MKPYRFHSAAQREYYKALDYVERQRVGFGRSLNEAIESAIDRIRREPNSFARYFDSDVRECILTNFPYVIYFSELDDCIWIAAVAHGSRRPGYWLKRTPEDT